MIRARALTVSAWVLTALLLLSAADARAGQLGILTAPGPLAKAHAALEGANNCRSCHDARGRTMKELCLSCHKPIADRIARNAGVHGNLSETCAKCHTEHTGARGELRPFDQRNFDHAAVTRFGFDGKHAALAFQCAACHKTRSFLGLSAACASCHADVHNGALGRACESCHSTGTAFKQAAVRFDHTKAAFTLVGRHANVGCAKCHPDGRFKPIASTECSACHADVHRGTFGAACSSCHTPDSWRTQKVDHARTTFPLSGRHGAVACTGCHRQNAMKVTLRGENCATCHADVHKGTFKEDCKSCHSTAGWGNTSFEHSLTGFALTGRHSGLPCLECHKDAVAAGLPPSKRLVDFRGLRTDCSSCHADVHQAQLGKACESCHSTSTFEMSRYRHERTTGFFGGQHAPVACDGCHGSRTTSPPRRTGARVLDVTFRNLSTACTACHQDPHLGQEGTECQRCHSVDGAKFALVGFSHDATSFPLKGKHELADCGKCHKREVGSFPAGTGAAVRFKGSAQSCVACHEDVHLGQFTDTCVTCHSTGTFKLPDYVHRDKAMSVGFFVGKHVATSCQSCHATVTGPFPKGRGTAVRFKVDTRCAACHTDKHRALLGTHCEDCHRPDEALNFAPAWPFRSGPGGGAAVALRRAALR
jgi:hypothetical protein